jgi:hypothetical protein
MREMYKIEEMQNFFGQAGEVTINGRKEYIAEGVYHQLKAGNWLKPPRWSKEVLMELGGKLFQNRPDIAPEDRYFEFQGGRGAVLEFQEIFAEQAAQTLRMFNVINDNSAIKILRGQPMNLEVGGLVGKIFIPGVGWFSIKYNAAFDAEGTRVEDAPIRRGFGTHSFTAAIFDVTDSVQTNAAKFGANIIRPEGTVEGSNIFMLKNKEMQGIKKTVLNGRTAPSVYQIMQGGAGVASSRRDEFTMMLESQSSTMIVDPTRSALVELKRTV